MGCGVHVMDNVSNVLYINIYGEPMYPTNSFLSKVFYYLPSQVITLPTTSQRFLRIPFSSNFLLCFPKPFTLTWLLTIFCPSKFIAIYNCCHGFLNFMAWLSFLHECRPNCMLSCFLVSCVCILA